MATGHFPNCSHNFEWYGLINHDRMITLTLQNKYDTTLPSGYPKFAYPLEISHWIRNLFTHGQTLPGRFAIGSETIDRRFGVVYRDVITGSRESRVHHYDTPSFTEFWNLYCPRTIHFSWRRRASLRTLPTTLIVRDWGNNGTICDSTCAARCRLLIYNQNKTKFNITKYMFYGIYSIYRQTSNIRHTLTGNKTVDHSDVVGASPIGTAPTTSSFST